MKKILLIISALVIGYMMYTHAIPTLPTGTAQMTQAEVGIKNVQNIRIKSQNGTTATIEVNYTLTTTTFTAPVINTDDNHVGIKSKDVCALIDTFEAQVPTTIKSALNNARYGVLCSSGILYTNVDVVKGGTGWQPGYLAYSNYLGNVYVGTESKNLGAPDLLNICNGTCQ